MRLFRVFGISLFLSLFFLSASSQVQWAEPFEAGKTRLIFGFADNNEESYLICRKAYNGGSSHIMQLNADLTTNIDKVIEKPQSEGSFGLREIIIDKGIATVLWQNYTNEISQFVSQEMNPSDLKYANDIRVLSGQISTYKGRIQQNVDYGEVLRKASPDKSKYVFSYSGPGFSESKALFQISSASSSNGMLYESSFGLEEPTKVVNRLDVAIGNDGASYAAVRIARGKGSEGCELIIWKFAADGTKAGELSVQYDGKVISEFGMNIAADGSLICAGIYSYKSLYGAQGTTFIKINTEEFSITSQKDADFDAALIENSSGSKKINGYESFKFQGPLILTNGNAVIGIEQNEGNVQPLVYRDIVAFEFDGSGSIVKTGIVRKHQNGGFDDINYLSFKLVTKNNKTYVVYNDVAKNSGIPGNEKHAKCIITGYNPTIIAELTSNGFIKKEACTGKDVKMRTSIAEIKQTSAGNLIFMQNQISGNNSNMRFGKYNL